MYSGWESVHRICPALPINFTIRLKKSFVTWKIIRNIENLLAIAISYYPAGIYKQIERMFAPLIVEIRVTAIREMYFSVYLSFANEKKKKLMALKYKQWISSLKKRALNLFGSSNMASQWGFYDSPYRPTGIMLNLYFSFNFSIRKVVYKNDFMMSHVFEFLFSYFKVSPWIIYFLSIMNLVAIL